MTSPEGLASYLKSITTTFKAELGANGGYITLANSGQRGEVKTFQVSLDSFLVTFEDILKNTEIFAPNSFYEEKKWRLLGEQFSDPTMRSLIGVQTKPVFTALGKIISWATQIPSHLVKDENAQLDATSIKITLSALKSLIAFYAPKKINSVVKVIAGVALSLPKPFILLAGISGTGKTRFVREQARAHRDDLSNYCLIPVRPDWHEPSDLFGYVSRLSTPRYVVTALLCFIVSAWKDAFQSASAATIEIKQIGEMTPFWCCLDEMNLAPVEQYFADYLAVLESREWLDGGYSCLPLLKADTFKTDPGITTQLREDLALSDATYDGLWAYFSTVGIPLPPNLVIAGTVNMDETTHGFSRKVIDRAFTIDFGAFFPNDFSHYFKPITSNKTLGFSTLSSVTIDDLAGLKADSNGTKTIAFLGAVNEVLKNTPFELAFRALNELLIALVCFEPKNDGELQAVWDDFLMSKVLPRIDGDENKLKLDDNVSLLTRLGAVAEKYLPIIWDTTRPDLLRENLDKSDLMIICRSKQKLAWMHQRLLANGFTSFWP